MTSPAMQSSPAAIVLDGLSVQLGGRPVLIQLEANLHGRAIGLLGPNGAGKTTLLRTLLGFYRPTEGDAIVLGRRLSSEGKRIRDLVGYMPESDAYIGHLTAVRFVRMMAELSGLPPEPALERAHEALFYVGLGEARYRPIGTFSTGMKQLVKLAQALVHGPELLMLDEPTNGLDPPARQRMLDLVCEIRDRGETRVVLSSHLLKDVETVCDEVIILKRGRVAAARDLDEERRANRAFVELELGADCPELIEDLQGLGCSIAVPGARRLKVVMPAEVTTRDLLVAAVARRATVRRLDCQRDSLQDLFLRAMEDHDGGV